jgi:hypothetical protein
MLYLPAEGGTAIVVVESRDLDEVKLGRLLITPDKAVMIVWTSDVRAVQAELHRRAAVSGGQLTGADVAEVLEKAPRTTSTAGMDGSVAALLDRLRPLAVQYKDAADPQARALVDVLTYLLMAQARGVLGPVLATVQGVTEIQMEKLVERAAQAETDRPEDLP